MALQWFKQPDGTMILWDPAKGGTPLSAAPDRKQTTDTGDAARAIFEDQQGTRQPGAFDLLAKSVEGVDAPKNTGNAQVDFNALVNAFFGTAGQSSEDLTGGQSVGSAEDGGYTPVSPTTGEETSAPVSKDQPTKGKTSGREYPGAEAFVQGLIKRGWTPEEAAAAAGNAHVESGFKPGVKSSVPNEKSFGFLQWNSARLAGLKNYASSKGMDWQDPEAQLDWINLERTGGSTKYGGSDESASYKKAFAGGGSAQDMAARFGKFVERPKDLSQSVAQRTAMASAYLKYASAAKPSGMPTPQVAAMSGPLHDKQPFSNTTMDEEMFSSILNQGGTSWG